jgi:hypothetical protein
MTATAHTVGLLTSLTFTGEPRTHATLIGPQWAQTTVGRVSSDVAYRAMNDAARCWDALETLCEVRTGSGLDNDSWVDRALRTELANEIGLAGGALGFDGDPELYEFPDGSSVRVHPTFGPEC